MLFVSFLYPGRSRCWSDGDPANLFAVKFVERELQKAAEVFAIVRQEQITQK